MSAESIYLLVVLAGALLLLYKGWVRHDVTALLVMIATMVPWVPGEDGLRGVLPVEEAVSGFGSPALVMVAAMFVLSAAMVRTGATRLLGGALLAAGARSELLFQLTVLAAITLFSAVINDTTTVLMWMPIVLGICRERGYAPNRLLIVLAYASLLGGQWTLIGTRSNIILSDYLRSRTGEGLGFFSFTPVAAAVFVVVVAWFLVAGRRLLPAARSEPSLADRYDVQEYLTEVLVEPSCDLLGRRLDELEVLRQHRIEVLQVVRGRRPSRPRPWVRLYPGDVLVVQGRVEDIARLMDREGLQVIEELRVDEGFLRRVDVVMAEAVLPPGSSMEGRTLGSLDLPSRYGVSVLGLARSGRPVAGRPLTRRLRGGDSILLVGHDADIARLRGDQDLLVLERRSLPPSNDRKGYRALALLVFVAVTSAAGIFTPAFVVPVAAVLAILTGCVSLREAYESLDLRALVVLGGMIPLGIALDESGTAAVVARAVHSSLEGFHPWYLLAVSLLFATGLTQIIENAAVAVIMAPVAYELAVASGANPLTFLLGMAICISTAFMTPVAHESTILVIQPGGYRFRDFLRFGTPLALLTWAVTVLVLPLLYPLRQHAAG